MTLRQRSLAGAIALTMHASLCAGQTAPAAADQPSHAPAPSSPQPTRNTEMPSAKARRIYLETEAEFGRSRDITKAWNGFEAASRADPNFAPAWFNLAVLLENERKWQQAQTYFQHYLALAPKGPDAGRALEQVRLLDKYISGEMSTTDIKRADYDAAIQRARALMAAGFYREAIADAGQAQALDNSRWEAYAVVSLCMLRQHKLAQAATMRDKAVELAPTDKREQVRAALMPTSTAEAQK